MIGHIQLPSPTSKELWIIGKQATLSSLLWRVPWSVADGLITIVHLFWSVRFQAMSRGKNWEVLNPGKVTLLFVVRLSKHDVCYISGRITDIYVVDEMKRCISIICNFFSVFWSLVMDNLTWLFSLCPIFQLFSGNK